MIPFTLAVAGGVAYALYYYVSGLVQSRKYYWLRNKVVLVTGASSGLGESLARQFYIQGCKVILVARNLDRLRLVMGAIVEYGASKASSLVQLHEPSCYQADLFDAESIERLVNVVLEKYPKIDILVNNAGVSVRASCLSTTMSVHRELMQVNYFGHVQLTHSLLERRVELRSIVCISSVQSLISVPERSAYAASKHAFHAYFDCLRAELGDQGIQVLVVCPAYVRTQLSMNALDGQGKKYGRMDASTMKGMNPDSVAMLVVKALVNNEEELILAPTRIQIAVLIRSIWPSLFFWLMRQRAARTRERLQEQSA